MITTKKPKRCGARDNMRLSHNPQDVTPELWYYEEPKGINIVHEIRHGGNYLQTDQILIPWAMIRQSLKRKERRLLRA